MTSNRPPLDLSPLLALVERLRAPDGCPWDREQTLSTVRAYLLEEAHETAAAIDEGDWEELAAELGDLLFQVAFIARLAEEAGGFEPAQVLAGVHEKMVRRHPHVFGEERLDDAAAVREAWERRKIAQGKPEPFLAGVARSLPALTAAYRMTQKAAGVGFDWREPAAVLAKIDEELAELRQAVASSEGGREAVQEEIGDLLFSVVNLARKLEIDPEAALAQTNRKFRHRFGKVEEGLTARGKSLNEATLEEMDALWEAAKVSSSL